MSPASYLTAPPRVAGRSIAVAFADRRPASIDGGMRVAAIDLGTNSTRLLVADVDEGRIEEVHRETVITRLGEDVDERRRLLPAPIARVRNTLSDFRRTAERLGAERTLAVATSAFRDAENGEAFLGEVGWSYGFATRLLAGDEEAELTLRGVTAERTLETTTLLLDVGGGSTELTVVRADGVRFRDSLELGSVRLTERFLASDPPAKEEVEECSRAIRSVLAERVPDDLRVSVRTAIGVAGTITTLAALELGEYDRDRVHAYRISRDAVVRQLERLASVPLAERRELPGMEPDRAPVIVAGAAIVLQVLEFFGLDELEVSEQDLLTGAALAAAELPDQPEGDAPPGAYTCC
jgi:exopolyphosphatase / guanosine-5'-triphosphate,3'-diphosphate pyrophosphatase